MTAAAIEQNLYGINEELIQEITARIVRDWHPHKVILFGSFAWSKPKSHSDLDLFIVMDSTIARPDMRAMQIKKRLRDFDCPKDLVAYTPDEVEMCLKKQNPFIRDVLTKGRVLYAR